MSRFPEKAWLLYADAPEAFAEWSQRVPAYSMYRACVAHMPNPDVPPLVFLAGSPGVFKCAFDPEQWESMRAVLQSCGIEIKTRMAFSEGLDGYTDFRFLDDADRERVQQLLVEATS